MLMLVASNHHLYWGVMLMVMTPWPRSQWWYPVPTLVSGGACDCVLAWDWGAAVVATPVGIDSLSPRLAWEENGMIYYFTPLLLFYFPDHPNCLFNMLLATQFRVHCLQYILSTCTLVYKCLHKHLFTRHKPNIINARLSWLKHIC